jgi:hypothetical protein
VYSQDSNWVWPGGIVRDADWSYAHAESGTMTIMIKKRIDLDKANVPWMVDYDVRVNTVNCALNVGIQQSGNSSKSDMGQYKSPQGVYVEKYADHFNIICNFVVDGPYAEAEMSHPADTHTVGGALSSNRSDFRGFGSNVYVTNESVRLPQNPNTNTLGPLDQIHGQDWKGLLTDDYNYTNRMSRNALCTYPTVKFEIIGYPMDYTDGIKMDAGTNSTITLVTS